jgi:hypothetical protein
MSRRVMQAEGTVATPGNDLLILDDDRAHRHFTAVLRALRFFQRQPHEFDVRRHRWLLVDHVVLSRWLAHIPIAGEPGG